MPISGFNIGREIAVDIVHPSLGVLNFSLITSYNARPMRRRLESLPITNGGKAIYRETYHGWEGTFEIDRADSSFDALNQLLEDNYYGGLPELYAMITETITNPDGTIDTYRLKNVILEPEDHGTWRGEEKVTQRLGFVASYRERV